VGADHARGDQVAVVVRSFEPVTPTSPFMKRHGLPRAALRRDAAGHADGADAGVRPLIKAIRGDKPKQKPLSTKEAEAGQAKGRGAPPPRKKPAAGEQMDAADPPGLAAISPRPRRIEPEEIDAAMVERHVEIAQQIVKPKPDSAVIALRQMLQPVNEETSTMSDMNAMDTQNAVGIDTPLSDAEAAAMLVMLLGDDQASRMLGQLRRGQLLGERCAPGRHRARGDHARGRGLCRAQQKLGIDAWGRPKRVHN
jgi:hypothetical protein